jgi:hypothetical protein
MSTTSFPHTYAHGPRFEVTIVWVDDTTHTLPLLGSSVVSTMFFLEHLITVLNDEGREFAIKEVKVSVPWMPRGPVLVDNMGVNDSRGFEYVERGLSQGSRVFVVNAAAPTHDTISHMYDYEPVKSAILAAAAGANVELPVTILVNARPPLTLALSGWKPELVCKQAKENVIRALADFAVVKGVIANDQQLINVKTRLKASVIVSSAKAVAMWQLSLLSPDQTIRLGLMSLAQRMNVFKLLHHVFGWGRKVVDKQEKLLDALRVSVETIEGIPQDQRDDLVAIKALTFDSSRLQHVTKFTLTKDVAVASMSARETDAISREMGAAMNGAKLPISPLTKQGADAITAVTKIIISALGIDKTDTQARVVPKTLAEQMLNYITTLATQSCKNATITIMCSTATVVNGGLESVAEAFTRCVSVIATRGVADVLCHKTAPTATTTLKSIETRLVKWVNGIKPGLLSARNEEPAAPGDLPKTAISALKMLTERIQSGNPANIFSGVIDLTRRVMEAAGLGPVLESSSATADAVDKRTTVEKILLDDTETELENLVSEPSPEVPEGKLPSEVQHSFVATSEAEIVMNLFRLSTQQMQIIVPVLQDLIDTKRMSVLLLSIAEAQELKIVVRSKNMYVFGPETAGRVCCVIKQGTNHYSVIK